MILTLHERAELLGLTARQLVTGAAPWFCEELVATATARERLRAWAQRGGLARPRRSLGDTSKAIRYYGDDEVWLAVVAALDRVPPPVHEFVIEKVVVMGIGWALNGMTFLVPVDLAARRLILVSGTSRGEGRVIQTTLHEVAHAWLEPDPDPDPADACDPVAFENLRAVFGARRDPSLEADVKREIFAMECRANNLQQRWATA